MGIITFISEDLAVIISVLSESLLKNIWHPSVLSMEIVGTLPKTWNEKKGRLDHFYWDRLILQKIKQKFSPILTKKLRRRAIFQSELSVTN